MPYNDVPTPFADREHALWIDRLDERITRAFDDLRHPGYVLAGVAAVGVALFLAFALVVSGQVQRGHERGEREAALRAELWRCGSESNALRADNCRRMARGEAPLSPLARWDDLTAPVSGMPAPPPLNGIVPVSLSR